MKFFFDGIQFSEAHRRSPHGERGLKYLVVFEDGNSAGRSPHGERGLKFVIVLVYGANVASLPTRGAWIEIVEGPGMSEVPAPSLPTRGAWIEINNTALVNLVPLVAPHTGSVD